ncbi:MAG: DUF4136 domain-containing protein [Gammaproteobacteria bacterium]|nr:DUF4136 domain-containing protein [Gammaproteobacteria bacterium]NND54786.1 DUF4136 domain-containing protein [Gammaproteobacteria bacterium]
MRTKLSNRKPVFVATLISSIALILSACATYPKHFSNESPLAEFDRYSTYAFAESLETDDKAEVRSLLSQYLISETRSRMAARGYVEDTENPDLIFNFRQASKEKVRNSPSVGISGGYGWGRSPYYGIYGSRSYDRVSQYTEGSLHLILIDARSKNVVWEGISVNRIDDTVLADVNASVRAAVAELFAMFPHYAPGAAAPTPI